MIYHPQRHYTFDALLLRSAPVGLLIVALSVALLIWAVVLALRPRALHVLLAYTAFSFVPLLVGFWGSAAKAGSALFVTQFSGADDPISLLQLGGDALIPLYLGAVASTLHVVISAFLLLFRTRHA